MNVSKQKSAKIINIIILFVIVALVATVIVLLFKQQQAVDSRTDSQKYYDAKCLSYATQNFNLSKGQIVFVGDSITDMYVLDDHYASLNRACYNRGIGGDTTAGVLNRLQVSVFDLVPSTVVLMIGTNDINGNQPEEDILNRYREIINKITTSLPGAKLYCVSIIPQNKQLEEYSAINVNQTTEAILQINPKIRKIVEDSGAVYIDLFPLLADSDNFLITEYSDDGIHLNEKGLSVWTQQMLPLLSD